MNKYFAHADAVSTESKQFDFYVEVYLANDVDNVIAGYRLALTRIMAFPPAEFRTLQDEIAIWKLAKEALGL